MDGRYGTVGEGKEVGWMKGMELDGCLLGGPGFEDLNEYHGAEYRY